MATVFQNFKDEAKVRRNTCSFTLAPTHVAYANTLRRLCMSHVPVVGFRADMTDHGTTTDVLIKTNSTPMTNEMLAHRVGLLSIYTPGEAEEWDNTRYKFVLHKVNTTDQLMDVCAEDFRVIDTTEAEPRPLPANQYFIPDPVTKSTSLIAVLKPQMPGGEPEEVHIEATASMGIGRENARFIPTCQCAYAYTPDTNPENLKRVFESWLQRVKMIPNAESLEQDQTKKQALLREFNSLERQRCYLKTETGEPYSFDFVIESRGILSPDYIVLKAVQAGVLMLDKFTGEALPGDVTVVPYDGNFRAIDFYFQKQDHTLGHCIQTWLDANRVGNGEITFAGYDIPHPLRDEMVLRIGVADAQNAEAKARQVLREAMTACRDMFATWAEQWIGVTGGVMPNVGGAAATAAPAKTPLQRLVQNMNQQQWGNFAADEEPEPAAAGGGGGAAEAPAQAQAKRGPPRLIRRPGQVAQQQPPQ
jgi:DNA-directed RNA polymerase subunit L/DNA-directed RNA polymerase alpha subunit